MDMFQRLFSLSLTWFVLLGGVAQRSVFVVAEGPQKTLVKVRFLVETTIVQTNAQEKLFLAGNIEALGKWKPNGVALQRTIEGKFQVELEIAEGTTIEFKVTRGSWDTVEVSGKGLDIANRRSIIRREGEKDSQTIEVMVEGWKEAKAMVSTITGDLRKHGDFPSKFLRQSRDVYVWLPPNYDSSGIRYPVLYLQDGQNLFDQATAAFGVEWEADESATRLLVENEISPLIIVGVGNSRDRIAEYTMSVDPRLKDGGKGSEYIRFLSEELKPFIDSQYRSIPERRATAIGGSSLGGLIALHACMVRPDTFGGCIAISPSLHWNEESMLEELSGDSRWPAESWAWMSMGREEGSTPEKQRDNIARAERLQGILLGQVGTRQVLLQIFDGEFAKHHERSWQRHFSEALKSAYSLKK
jgi:predicted alpha/beta superfamily hydrolase